MTIDILLTTKWSRTDKKEVKVMLFTPKERGQGMVEYALIIVLIAIVVIIVLTVLGSQISTVFSEIASALQGA
jgi:pilus assembly protein Flp/PilA